MTSPPGTYQNICGFTDGSTVTVQAFYDVTTGAVHEVGSPPAAMLVTNTGKVTAPVTVTKADGTQQVYDVPPGTTRLRATQLASNGITTVEDLRSIGVACVG